MREWNPSVSWKDVVGRNEWRYAYAGCLGQILYDDEYHRAGEVMATTVQEDKIFLTGLDVCHSVAVDEPQVELTDGGIGDGDETLFGSLAGDTDEFLV